MKVAPFLAILFFIPAMNLGGIPPMSGFIGKLGLLRAGAELGTPLAWAAMVGGVVTSLLTLMAMAKVWNRAFWGAAPAEEQRPGTGDQPEPERVAAEPGGDAAGHHEETDIEVDEYEEANGSRKLMPPVMALATTGLVLFSLALTVFAGPLMGYADRATEALRDGSYVAAVLPEGQR